MTKRLIPWMVALPCLIGGCVSYRLDRVDQLYLGQSYLPLPQGYVPDAEISNLVQDAPAAAKDADCTQPQMRWRDANGGGRPYAQALPGMTLREVATTYERNRAFVLPVIAESQWTIPATGRCGDDVLWNRESLLRVRHLLTRAVGEATVVNTPPDTDYYMQAIRRAGCAANGSCAFADVRRKFLEPFVNGLRVTYRDTGLTWQQTSVDIPAAVVQTQPADARRLAQWFQTVNNVRDADFFNFSTPYTDANGRRLDMGALCARLKAREPATPQLPGFTQNSEVERACNFNLKRLAIPGNTWPLEPATDWVRKLAGGELTLLQTGDAMMIFRPAAHAEVLDSAARSACMPGAGQTTLDCGEAQRLSQGFVDFELLFDVSTVPHVRQVRVPITMTVTQFEILHGNGAKVHRIKRSLVWVPSELAAVDLSGTGAASEAKVLDFADDRFVELRFMAPGSEEGRRKRGLYIHDTLKDQVLLAPGDVLTMSR